MLVPSVASPESGEKVSSYTTRKNGIDIRFFISAPKTSDVKKGFHISFFDSDLKFYLDTQFLN